MTAYIDRSDQQNLHYRSFVPGRRGRFRRAASVSRVGRLNRRPIRLPADLKQSRMLLLKMGSLRSHPQSITIGPGRPARGTASARDVDPVGADSSRGVVDDELADS
jgi:hypothetical protein